MVKRKQELEVHSAIALRKHKVTANLTASEVNNSQIMDDLIQRDEVSKTTAIFTSIVGIEEIITNGNDSSSWSSNIFCYFNTFINKMCRITICVTQGS